MANVTTEEGVANTAKGGMATTTTSTTTGARTREGVAFFQRKL